MHKWRSQLLKCRLDGKRNITIGKIEPQGWVNCDSFFQNFKRAIPTIDKLSEAQLNHHVHVVGASGFGKTVFLSQIVKQKIENGSGLLFIDLKNDVETIYSFLKMAENAGREKDIQMFSLIDREFSHHYNLINHGSATQIRDRIMQSLIWSEEYYKHVSSSYLLKTLIALVFLRDTQSVSLNLESVFKTVSSHDFLREINDKLKLAPANIKDPFREALVWVKDQKNWQSIEGLRSQIESLVRSDFGELLVGSDREIDLFKSAKQGKIVLLFLDSRRYGETARTVGRFILQDLKFVSARIDAEVRREERKPFTVIIDEFADLAQEDFIAFLDRARSSKMSIVVAHQEIADLKRISEEFAGRLMGNTSTLYAFLQKRPESAELISKIAGTRKVKEITHQTTSLFGFHYRTGTGSEKLVDEFIIHPNVIKSLKVGECIAIKKYPQSKAYKMKVSF